MDFGPLVLMNSGPSPGATAAFPHFTRPLDQAQILYNFSIDGVRQGAPQAKQVADRFQLLQNFQRTIEHQLSRAPRPNRQPSPSLTEAEPVILAGWIGHGRQPALVEHRQLGSIGRRAVNTDKFNQVKALQLSGHRITAIVRQTKFSRRTVTKWVQLDALPERNVMAPKPNTPSGFHDHLAPRWAEGCTSGRALLLEICGGAGRLDRFRGRIS